MSTQAVQRDIVVTGLWEGGSTRGLAATAAEEGPETVEETGRRGGGGGGGGDGRRGVGGEIGEGITGRVVGGLETGVVLVRRVVTTSMTLVA
ncbi:hypothetical protein Tdes44962_MAKER08087 [Teratosphaeria destructans]|uniref:Uncharacterized protein n=1 Tax=Teratosphaeria destructans TaxID=418781 RepID=A0A9W7SX79_9PEZI|nr:hypothetical protein Tdes44962_MAKER08087 [Teratosphaeria destructans]